MWYYSICSKQPGVAQLGARLTGGQEAVSSSLATRTNPHTKVWGLFLCLKIHHPESPYFRNPLYINGFRALHKNQQNESSKFFRCSRSVFFIFQNTIWSLFGHYAIFGYWFQLLFINAKTPKNQTININVYVHVP